MLHEYIAVCIDYFYSTRFRDLKCSRVRAILFRFLSHETDVGDVTHCRDIKLSVFDTVCDHLFMESCISRVRDNRYTLFSVAVSVPLLTALSYHDRHRGINDHIIRCVKVGLTLIRINHCDLWAVCINDCLECRFDLCLFRMTCDLLLKISHTEIRVDTKLFKEICILVEHIFEEYLECMSEHDRIRDLHHRCFEVDRPDYTLLFRLFDRFSDKLSESLDRHECTIEDLTLKRIDRFELFAVEKDLDLLCLIHSHRLFIGVEVPFAAHMCNIRFRVFGKRLQSMRVFLRIVFYRSCRTSVRVTFTQYRVDRRTETNTVFCLNFFLFRSFRIFRIVWNVKSLRLKLCDTLFELTDRSRDIWKLDNVRFRFKHKLPELCQLIFSESHCCEHSTRE